MLGWAAAHVLSPPLAATIMDPFLTALMLLLSVASARVLLCSCGVPFQAASLE